MRVRGRLGGILAYWRARPGSFFFLCGGFAGFVMVLTSAWMSRQVPVEIKPFLNGVGVTSQLQLRDIRRLTGRFATIIDLRPDGEAPDQPSSSDVSSMCNSAGIKFEYVPVPHGTIPDSAVQALSHAIASSSKPILLYCRTGKRAVRTYCLAEASRPDGESLETILAAANTAGQSADDLAPELSARIAHRGAKKAAKP